ncbi:MAG: nitrogen regulation protein NR(II) [Pseudomonadota bacterium]
MIEHLTTSVIVVNDALEIVAANAAAENLLRAGRSTLKRYPLSHWFLDADLLQQELELAAKSSATYAGMIRLREESSREVQYVDVRIAPYAGGNQQFLIEFTDVTSRRRINRDHTLLSQHDAGRMMARQLAHEIKNPLGGLRGAAQLMARQSDSAALKAYTDVIIAEADRLATLVDSLLGPGEQPRKDPTNIHEILEHVVNLVGAEQGSHIEWSRDYDPSIPLLELDRDQMVQAVLNLVSNATAAATSDKQIGEIRLRTRAVTNETIGESRHRVIAVVQIEDNGPGIDPDIRESIFYPLITGRPGGTGIGLPLSQELINRHGGLIEFSSEPGRTVFEIRLPIAMDGAEHE